MKTIGLILLMLAVQGCFYHRYFKDDQWWYLEDWDTNSDLVIDKNEFAAGFEKYKVNNNAANAFASADENNDDLLSAVEFYKWEEHL